MKTMCFYHRILQNLGLSENFLFMKSLLRKSRSDKKVHNTMASLIWSRDMICLHILLHRKKFLCSKICKQIMFLDQMRDAMIGKCELN